MSSAMLSHAAALRRPFIFDDDAELEANSLADSGLKNSNTDLGCPTSRRLCEKWESRILPAKVTPASQLEIRPAPEMVTSGIAELDALTGGLPRGCLTEICGPASSGRTTVLLAALAAATHRGEFCALIDASDALDAHSIAATGVDLDRLLWVRCGEYPPRRHRDTEKTFSKNPSPGGLFSQSAIQEIKSHHSEQRLDQVLRATDLLLESGGFGLITLDLADLPLQAVRRIPLTTWFRFRRAVEYKPTLLLAIEQQPIAGSCSSLLLQLGVLGTQYPVLSTKPSHSQLLSRVEVHAELIRSRLERKPARSITFETKTAWAG